MKEIETMSENEKSEPYCFLGLILNIPISDLMKVDEFLESLPEDVKIVYRKTSLNYLRISEVSKDSDF